MEDTAIEHNIKYQVEVSPYPTGTDANPIQLSGNGVRTAVVSIPCRYMHTPHEICSKLDIDSTITLLASFLCEKGLYWEDGWLLTMAKSYAPLLWMDIVISEDFRCV